MSAHDPNARPARLYGCLHSTPLWAANLGPRRSSPVIVLDDGRAEVGEPDAPVDVGAQLRGAEPRYSGTQLEPGAGGDAGERVTEAAAPGALGGRDVEDAGRPVADEGHRTRDRRVVEVGDERGDVRREDRPVVEQQARAFALAGSSLASATTVP